MKTSKTLCIGAAILPCQMNQNAKEYNQLVRLNKKLPTLIYLIKCLRIWNLFFFA